MADRILILRVLGALALTIGALGLGAVTRSRLVRWLVLAATLALGWSGVRFAVAWASQLAAGRQPTEGAGYLVMVLMTPIALAGVVASVLPLLTHLALWKALPAPAPMKRPALASVLGAFTLLGLFGLATPGALAGPAPSAVLAVGYPGQGSELLAVLQDGRVLSWGQGARPQTRWTLGPEAKGELHLLLQRRAVLRLVQDELTLFSLPDDGSPQELVKARGRVWAEVGPELLAVGDGRLVVVRSIDHGTERRFSWRANVTALAGGDDGTLVVADADSAVTWLDLSTFEPTRHLQLPHAARALFPLGERGVLANAGGAWLLDTQGGSKSLSTSWPGGMMGGQVLLVPRGPELQRFELAGSMGGPLFNHGIGVAALAGHPLQLVSAVVLEHELWRVTFRGQGHVEEQKLYEW